ncbi:DUF2493 domain-containing protein [Streptomyces sp. 1222.5]|uniref:DUF2493 domain-containing protein n=1 Tax=Streptomyces sp. 1222.5 TaxID=1881026 RepID=UPI003EB6DCC6
MTYRILVTGSRDWTDHNLVRDALANAIYQHTPAVIVHGACPTGADAIASWWARSYRHLSVTEEAHPADWDHCTDRCLQGHRKQKRPDDTAHPGVCDDYCPAAGPRRNRELIRLGADVCLAFIKGGSRGASHTARLAEQAGIPVRRWRP